MRFFPLSQLLRKLKLARADGTYPKFLNTLAKAHLLILDDWLRSPLSEAQTTDILEIIEDRYNRRSTLLATQVPVSECHELFGNPTLAGAIRDRLIHNAYRLDLDGDPMRKKKSSLTHSGYLKV